MPITLALNPQAELAPGLEVQVAQTRAPQYGRYLEAFSPGEVFAHPRGYTFDRAGMLHFARCFHQANPIYLNLESARTHGHHDVPASPQMVFNVVLSLGVQNDSEKALANLGYYNVQFLRPVYPGDTLTGMTQVVDRRERGEGKPGIVTIRTLGVNQDRVTVLQYERKIMVPPGGNKAAAPATTGEPPHFPWMDPAEVKIPSPHPNVDPRMTGPATYFEDLSAGDILVHANGRTITDEHLAWTYLVGNTHPLHFDRLYSASQSGPMSGEPIVYGGLVFAWLEGLASRDLSENALWDLGYTEGYHTQPVAAGDTVSAITRVLDCQDAGEGDWGEAFGFVTAQLIGVKNLTARDALDRYGADLFVKENDKKGLGKAKISDKIFEIERRLLLKRRPQ